MASEIKDNTKSHSDSLPLASVLAYLSMASEKAEQQKEVSFVLDNQTPSSNVDYNLITAALEVPPSSSNAGGGANSTSSATSSGGEGSGNVSGGSSSHSHSVVGSPRQQRRVSVGSPPIASMASTKLSSVDKAANKLRRRKSTQSTNNRLKNLPNSHQTPTRRLSIRRRSSSASIGSMSSLPSPTAGGHISPSSSPCQSPLASPKSSPKTSPKNSPRASAPWKNQIDMTEMVTMARKSRVLTSNSSLSDDRIISLIRSSSVLSFIRGEFVCQQGEEGDGMYVLLSGQILILRTSHRNGSDSDDSSDYDSEQDDDLGGALMSKTRNQKLEVDHNVPDGYRKVAEIHKGGTFCETSLLNNVPRNASACVKTSDATLLFISRSLFQKLKKWGMLDLSTQLHRSKVRTKLYDILAKTPCLSELSQDMIFDLVDLGERRKYRRGEIIFHEGQPGKGLHIILSGNCEIIKMNQSDMNLDQDGAKHDSSKADVKRRLAARRYLNAINLSTLTTGDITGETSLLTNNPRNATARATTRRGGDGVTTLFISSRLYRKVEKESAGLLETEIVRAKMDILRNGFLDRVSPFNRLSNEKKSKLVETMRLLKFEQGAMLCKQNEIASRMFFLIKGRVKVTIKPSTGKKEEEVASLCAGKFFGEIALVREDCRRTAR